MLPLLACATFLGCHDLLSSDRPPSRTAAQSATGHTVAVLDCTASVQSGTITCAPAQSARGDNGASRALLGQGQIKMASTNVAFDAATRIFRADVTTQNLLAEAIGTPDGSTVTGVKVFFASGPTPTSFTTGDTGTVRVENPDGYGNFTAAHQPYFLYPQILAPNQISVLKQWRWYLGPTVNSFSFQVKVFAAKPTDAPLPPEPPKGWLIPTDSVRKLFSAANASVNGPRLPGFYPRNVLLLLFSSGSTPEERQVALDQVQGSVIGGAGQFYVVQVPSDGTNARLWSAIDQLSALPQVVHAGPDELENIIVNYVRPDDGAGWRKTDWEIDPDSARGDNWAPEAVQAPQAWGCETGTQNGATIAVVDKQEPGVPHFQWVASIIREPANDSVGMSGLLWQGTFQVTDANRGDPADTAHLAAANLLGDLDGAIANSNVINLSWGLGYRDAQGLPRLPNNDTTDLNRARRFGAALAESIKQSEATYHRQPLYVVAAGNFQMDAVFSGTPLLVQDSVLRSRVVVVAASDSVRAGPSQRLLWANSGVALEPGTDIGPLVSLAAPGNEVMASANGAMSRVMGTSFAAPHVAGAAGLLQSFDPRLTADSIKRLLVAGALRGKRTAGGFPYLSAYESLKLAAQRPGAPLCGSRVWQQNGHIYTQRDTTPGAPGEALFASTAHVTDIQVRHGGRRVEINDRDGGGHRLFEWTAPSTWIEVPDTAVRYDSIFITTAPSYHSYYGESHDGDSIAYYRTVGASFEIHVQHIDTMTYNVLSDVIIARIPTGDVSNQVGTCTLKRVVDNTCQDSSVVGSARSAGVAGPAFAPLGDSVLVAVNHTNSDAVAKDWTACPHPSGDGSELCRSVETTWSYDAELYAIPLRGAVTPHQIGSASGSRFAELQVADGAGELTLQVVTGGGSGQMSYRTSVRWDKVYTGTTNETCRTEFRKLKSPGTVAAFFGECSPAAATFSPSRSPSAGGGASSGAWSALFPAGGRTPGIFAAPAGGLLSLLARSPTGFLA
jgi:hypothetical protein